MVFVKKITKVLPEEGSVNYDSSKSDIFVFKHMI